MLTAQYLAMMPDRDNGLQQSWLKGWSGDIVAKCKRYEQIKQNLHLKQLG